RWLCSVRLRLRSLFRRKAFEAELEDELQFHLEKHAELSLARGLSPEEARASATRAFGGHAQVKEEGRDMSKFNVLETVLQDVRYALRILRAAPGFAAIVILSLAVGIGANTAIFSVMDALLLRRLPVPHPERLVTLEQVFPDGRRQYNLS